MIGGLSRRRYRTTYVRLFTFYLTHSRFRARGLLAVTAAGEAASLSLPASENGSAPNASVRPRERASADSSAAAARDDGVGGDPNTLTESRERGATTSSRRASTEAARRRALAQRARASAARADGTNAGSRRRPHCLRMPPRRFEPPARLGPRPRAAARLGARRAPRTRPPFPRLRLERGELLGDGVHDVRHGTLDGGDAARRVLGGGGGVSSAPRRRD